CHGLKKGVRHAFLKGRKNKHIRSTEKIGNLTDMSLEDH
ncbi:unnamed protein product, partial [marine sediment metagenome]